MIFRKMPLRSPFVWLAFKCILVLSLHGSANSYSFMKKSTGAFDRESFTTHSIFSRQERLVDELNTDRRDVFNLIPKNYSILDPPPKNNDKATKVELQVFIFDVRDIVEHKDKISLDVNLVLFWEDTRLQHLTDPNGNKTIILNPVLLEKLWHPDLIVDNVKSVSQASLISNPTGLLLSPTSLISLFKRITLKMACKMDFHYYPADIQRYAYDNQLLDLNWTSSEASLTDDLKLPNYDLALIADKYNFDGFAILRLTILMRRRINYQLIQTYLPSTLFIFVSWLGFLVPPEWVPERIALCMTTLLTLTAMFSGVRQNTPDVSYVKALDIWMIVCVIFVFFPLLENTVILKLKSMKPELKLQPENEIGSEQQPSSIKRWKWSISPFLYKCPENILHSDTHQNSKGIPSGFEEFKATVSPAKTVELPVPPAVAISEKKVLNKYRQIAQMIVWITSVAIPILLVIFNFIYWPWLLNRDDIDEFLEALKFCEENENC